MKKALGTHLYNFGQAIQFIVFYGVVSLIVGGICGLVGAFLYHSIHQCDILFATKTWMAILLPLGGLVIVYIYQIMGADRVGTDTLIQSVQADKEVTFGLFPAICIGTVITHLFGGSAGKEGVAIQSGGAIGYFLGKHVFHLSREDVKVVCMAGMSAMFAAVFGMPVAAALFVTFFVEAGTFVSASLVPGIMASIFAYRISMYFGMVPLHFSLEIPAFNEFLFLKVMILAILCGVISTIFCDALHLSHKVSAKFFPNPYLRILVAGLLIAGVVFLLGGKYSGSGVDFITAAVERGEAAPYDFLIKILLTAITLGCGYRGGEIMPAFFIGATFGCVAAPILGIPAAFGAAIGMICVFVGATNQIIAPIIMALEMFDGQGILLFSIAVVICYIAAGYTGIYGAQKIVFSSVSMKRIDVNVEDEYRDTWKSRLDRKEKKKEEPEEKS